MPQEVEDMPRTSGHEQGTEEEDNASGTEVPMALSEWRDYIREDYITLLKENLLRWKQEGLSHQTPLSNPSNGKSGCGSLERVYHCVCQLDIQMEDDQIRKRVALILLHLEFEPIYSREWKVQSRNKREHLAGIGQGDANL